MKCLKDFTQKSHYDYHNNKKNPCSNAVEKIQTLIEKIELNNINDNINNIDITKMLNSEKNNDYNNFSKTNLLKKCNELGITKYFSKNKIELINLIKTEEIKSKEQKPEDKSEDKPEDKLEDKPEDKLEDKSEDKPEDKPKVKLIKFKEPKIKFEDIPKIKLIKSKEPKIINYIDLFCGLGAFHKAFDMNSSNDIKYNCVFACDIDIGIQKLYKENYDIDAKGDITKINIDDIPNFDILCAGFPCQPFSLAGKKDGFGNKEKGNLFFNILDIIDKKQPKQIILENVKNLLSINEGKTFNTIINELKKRDYHVNYKVIDSKYYNCPQSRQRLFIVCDKNKKYIFRNIQNKIIKVSSILDNNIDTFFNYDNKYKLEECKNSNIEKNGCIMKYKLINKISNKGGRQGERVYSINTCGPTICASSGGPGSKTGFYHINDNIRTLTVNETLQMFSFNIDYKRSSIPNDNDMLYYLGNSIVVNVLYEIIKDL
jgi:DNA (cytosine-5)-methyltransferase 1